MSTVAGDFCKLHKLSKYPSIFRHRDSGEASLRNRQNRELVLLKGLRPAFYIVTNKRDAVKLVNKGFRVLSRNY